MLRGINCLRLLQCHATCSTAELFVRWRNLTSWNSWMFHHNTGHRSRVHTQPFPIIPCQSPTTSLPERRVSTPSLCQHSTSTSAAHPHIQQRDDHLSITVNGQTFRTSYLWLRDHCRCSECYEHTCHENFVDIVALPSNIKPKKLSLDDGNLSLTWPDDHVTTYSLQWVQENAPGQATSTDVKQVQPLLWDKESLLKNPPEDVHITALRNGDGLRKIMENLHVFGLSFVSGLEATKESTEEAIRLISPPMKTHYGEVWEYQNDGEIADAGYTSLALKNHTDHTYFNHAAGGLVLHCIYHDGTGGENTLVDGFQVAQHLRETQPEHYTTLLNIPVVSHYLDKTYDFRCCHTVLRHNALTDQLQQLRFNPHDRRTLSYLPYEDAEKFYAAYRALGRMINSPDSEMKIKLQPGRMVVFDNMRILHGRAEFTGKRVMVGCFFTNDDLQNLKRTAAKLEA